LAPEFAGQRELFVGEGFLQCRIQLKGVGFYIAVQMTAGMFEPELDGLAHILLRLLPKTLEQQQAILLAGIQEFSHRLYLHVFPDRRDLFWAEPLDGKHVDDPGWSLVDIFFEEAQFPGLLNFQDLFADRIPNPLDRGDLFQGQSIQLHGQFFQREGRHRIRFCLEGIFAVDVHDLSQQAELGGDIVVVDCHGTKVRHLPSAPKGRSTSRSVLPEAAAGAGLRPSRVNLLKSKSPGSLRDFIIFC
jgi:hypothetical protein